METAEIISLISNIGFPIACTVALFVAWQKDRKESNEAMDKLRDAIVNNTIVMNELLDRLKGG